jgi:hypothetical protein
MSIADSVTKIDSESSVEAVTATAADPAAPAVVENAPRITAAPLSGAARQLLRSAVSLQAEDILRTIGALAQKQRDVREWAPLVERDARDLALLAAVAVEVGAPLPAGLDGGVGDPDDPATVMEGLLASHEALMGVLGELVTTCGNPRVARVVADVLERREEQATVMRALGAGVGLPAEQRLVQGVFSKYEA